MLTFLKELCRRKEFRNDYESTKLKKILTLTAGDNIYNDNDSDNHSYISF